MLKEIDKIQPREKGTDNVQIVIDTPRGSRNKYAFDPELGLFKLRHILPAGAVFPFDFGSIPNTAAEDGDPIDVVLLIDEPTFSGCLVTGRLIGVIAAEQTQEGRVIRNDRLIAVASEARTHKEVTSISELSPELLDEIEHFFISYNEMRGRNFSPIGRFGPDRAEQLLQSSMKNRPKGKTQEA